jgi:hypothetical protein
MMTKLALSLILLAAAGPTAVDSLPKPGSYGFNWLDAGSQCKKLTAKDLAAVKSCTVSTNAFGLELKSHACTAAHCQEALETMQANGD